MNKTLFNVPFIYIYFMCNKRKNIQEEIKLENFSYQQFQKEMFLICKSAKFFTLNVAFRSKCLATSLRLRLQVS